MAHQYIYILHEHTDEFGWQYRTQWSALGPPGPKDEPWTPTPTINSRVRRRIWLTTIVPKYELVRAKRLLAENLKIDYGNVKLQGELYRYEKGTLNKSWNKRRFILYHNRIEIYMSSTKKTEILLQDCEVKMLPDGQIAGAKNVFVVRNVSGTVNLLLSAEDPSVRQEWVFAIQYQLALNSPDVNFIPLEYSPPTSDYPDNRVLVAGDLKLQNPAGDAFDRTFQLLPREVVYFDGEDLKGRIFVEKAAVAAEERNLNFSLTSATGITLNLAADTPEQKNMWMLSVRKQVQYIEAYNTMKRNLPREEQEDPNQPAVDRISQFYDGNWSAPPVAGEDEEYIRRIFTAPYENHPDHFEFSEELGIRFDKKPKPEVATFKVDVQTRAHTTELIKPTLNRYKSMQIITEDLADIKEIAIPTSKLEKAPEIHSPSLLKIKELVLPERKEIKTLEEKKGDSTEGVSPASSAAASSPAVTPSLPQTTRSMGRLKSTMSMLNMTGAIKFLNVKRVLINPRFMLAALKGITHRFVLVLESENRINAPRDIQDLAPLRFTVGGSRASKDPRMVRFDQLIGISNKNPEVQLPPGWFMLHQYINIVQSNTDDYGWQYRSTWSEGTLNATDEQWVDICDENKQVRRRLWMTTVVKRDDFMKAKKMVGDELSKSQDDFILKEDLYLHDPEKGTSASSWQRRNVILYHNKVEFYSGNEKINDVSLVDCEVKVLTGADAAGRSFPFCIYHPNGSINVKLDATDKDMRLRWIRALLYQLAIITPDVNFSPFVFGPPTGELPENRILLCGDLEVLDNASNNWDLQQIQLQEQCLLVLQRDGALHGRLLLDHAVVKAREDECEFTVKTADGLIVHFRAFHADTKYLWVRFLKRLINFVEFSHNRKSNEESGNRLIAKHYHDSEWIGREGEYGEDDAHMRALRQEYTAKLMSTWSGERGSETPTASALVTEQWRVTQQSAAMKLHGSSTTSDITQVVKYPDMDSGTDFGSQSTEPIVKTITRVVKTATTTTTTTKTSNMVEDDSKEGKTIFSGSTSMKDVVESTQKQVNGENMETTIRNVHIENSTGTPIDMKNIPIPPNLLSKFGKTKSPTNSSGRIMDFPGDDTPNPNSPLRNQSLRLTSSSTNPVASETTSTNSESVATTSMKTESAASLPSSHKDVSSFPALKEMSKNEMLLKPAATIANNAPAVDSSNVKGSVVTSPTLIVTATKGVSSNYATQTVNVASPVAVSSTPQIVTPGEATPTTQVVSPMAATKVSSSVTITAPVTTTATTSYKSGTSTTAAAPTTSRVTEEHLASSTTATKVVIDRTSVKPIPDVEVPKTPEFVRIALRGVAPGTTGSLVQSASSNENIVARKVALLSPKMSAASAWSNNSEFDDLDEMLDVRKEDIEYHDDDDDGHERTPVHMHTSSQYFTEEEEDKGEDFEEAAKAAQQLLESNDAVEQGNAQQKLRTLNQMTIGYMRRLGYVDGLSPSHALIPMNHLNDYDQAYVVDNGFFRDGEDNPTHAYIPLEALRRSLMSLEAERNKTGDDIKKVTLRHVPTNLLIRRGIDKPSEEPESELLREARRRATTRRFDESNIEGNNANNDSEEPEFLREARRRQQSRRVSMPDENMEYGQSSKGGEAEPEFLREAKRRQASRRLSLDAETNGNKNENNGEVENEAVREARRREQRRRELEEEASRSNKKSAGEEMNVGRTKSAQDVAVAEPGAAGMVSLTVDTTASAADYEQTASSAAVLSPLATGGRMSFASPNSNTIDEATESSSVRGGRMPPLGGSSSSRRASAPAMVSLSNPGSFDLEEEISLASKRLRPVAADDMSVNSLRDDVSMSSQKRRAVRLKNMSTEYLQRKGYLLPGNDFATIPLQDLRSSDQKLVTENGFLNEEGTHAIIALKNTDTSARPSEAETGKLTEQVSLKPVSREGLPPPRPGLQREDSILKTVQLRPVGDRRPSETQQPLVSPLVQVKQKLRRVSASTGANDSGAEDNWGMGLASASRDDDDTNSVSASPFKGVKLRSVQGGKTLESTSNDEGGEVTTTTTTTTVGLGVAVDNDDEDDAFHSVQDLRARINVRSNSIIGKIQKFEKPNTPTAAAAGGSGAASFNNVTSPSSEVRGISRSTSIAAKRNSEVAIPPSSINASSAAKPPAGRSMPVHPASASGKPPTSSNGSPRADKPEESTTPTTTPGNKGTTASIAASANNMPPNPLLQRKKSMTDKGLGAPKKSFRF
jgi:hypothetical protein